jgi:toxin YoeB
MSEKTLEFDKNALEDLTFWISQDRRKALKIMEIVDAIQRDPFNGIGKPEPLKFTLAGCWSRRIDLEHRIVYQITSLKIRILSCRYHYS